MPNWCMNTMKVRGPLSELKRFYKVVEDADKNCKIHQVSNLYQVFIEAGFDPSDIQELGFSRGHIDYFTLDKDDYGDVIVIDYESAWSSNYEAFNALLDRFFPTLKANTIAEEPGCEVFINTDDTGHDFSDRYKIDVGSEGEEFEDKIFAGDTYFEYESDCVDRVNEILGTNYKSVKEIQDADEDRIIVNEFATC